jgi:Kef-type K+ transport system membrane component KefB
VGQLSDHGLGLFLIGLAVLIGLGHLFAAVLARLGQPSVLGEILAGILIGPSLLGAIAPGAISTLFTPDALTLLTGVGNAGLVLFVFLVGAEIDRPTVRRRFGQVVKIATGSFLLPFVAGLMIAGSLQAADSEQGRSGVSGLAFALFVGTAFAVTAFPVLARILADRKLERSAIGAMSLAAAGMLDLVGWMLLAVALTVAAGDGLAGVGRTALAFAAFAILVVRVGAPLLVSGLRRLGDEAPIAKLSALSAAIFVCAGATQLIGLHSVIGALLLGVALPTQDLKDVLGGTRRELAAITGAVLLPVYFAIAGMGVNVSGFGTGDALELLLLMAAVTATKIAGTMLGARWAGLTWREGLPLGVLMNTRGLMEVVVLNIGLSAGILDETLYSELMLVALVATSMTAPIVQRLRSRSAGWLWSETSQRRGERPASLEAKPGPLPQHSF